MKKIYLVVMLLAAMLTGCAASSERITAGSVNNAYKLAKDDSGVVYGPWTSGSWADVSVEKVCKDINNSDARCANQSDYIAGIVVPEVGYAAGWASVITLMPKTMDIKFCGSTASSSCTFLKVKAEVGKLGTVIEVASVPGDKKCYWDGIGTGGTVCPAYGWDYREKLRNFDAASATSGNGVLSVK